MSKSPKSRSPHPTGPSRRSLIGGLVGLVLVAVLALLPRLGVFGSGPQLGGAFTLTDHHGKTVTQKSYADKLRVMFFGYTYCPDICPGDLATLGQAYDLLAPEEQAQVALLFVSVDPDRDTPSVLASYVAAFSPAITGLVGTPEQLEKIKKAFNVIARKSDPNNPDSTIDHSALFYLCDRDGNVVRVLPHGASAAVLVEAVRAQLTATP